MMKKWMLVPSMLLASRALLSAVEPTMSQGVDCELFLQPYLGQELKEVSAYMIVSAGLTTQSEAPVCLDLSQCPIDKTLSQLAERMQQGAKLVIAAPASHNILFTKGDRPESVVRQQVDEVLATIQKDAAPESIKSSLAQLDGVMRATFVVRDGTLKLVTDEKELQWGERIWCKVPGDVVETAFHSEEEYLIAIKRAGLHCEEIKRPCFFGKVKYDMWRTFQHECGKSLGESYINHHPFTIYYMVKAAA